MVAYRIDLTDREARALQARVAIALVDNHREREHVADAPGKLVEAESFLAAEFEALLKLHDELHQRFTRVDQSDYYTCSFCDLDMIMPFTVHDGYLYWECPICGTEHSQPANGIECN